jgi:uncharacterized protein YneF (UPF0154 family)
MPEQLTKHPEVTLQVLRSAGAQCGEGAAQQILVRCPAARFCKLPGGEVCVYGLADAGQMTQVSRAEFQTLAATLAPAAPSPPPPPPQWGPGPLGAIAAALLVGAALGAWLVRRTRRQGP